MYTLEDIQAVDMEVADAITKEFDRQNSHIELIASENWVSPALMRGNFLRTIRHTIAMIAPYAASDNIIPKKNT